MIQEVNRLPRDPNIDPPENACYFCWNPSHPEFDCPQPLYTEFCWNCGRLYVTLENCPRCSELRAWHWDRVKIESENNTTFHTLTDRSKSSALLAMKTEIGENEDVEPPRKRSNKQTDGELENSVMTNSYDSMPAELSSPAPTTTVTGNNIQYQELELEEPVWSTPANQSEDCRDYISDRDVSLSERQSKQSTDSQVHANAIHSQQSAPIQNQEPLRSVQSSVNTPIKLEVLEEDEIEILQVREPLNTEMNLQVTPPPHSPNDPQSTVSQSDSNCRSICRDTVSDIQILCEARRILESVVNAVPEVQTRIQAAIVTILEKYNKATA